MFAMFQNAHTNFPSHHRRSVIVITFRLSLTFALFRSLKEISVEPVSKIVAFVLAVTFCHKSLLSDLAKSATHVPLICIPFVLDAHFLSIVGPWYLKDCIVHGFQLIDIATSLLANHRVASEYERARSKCSHDIAGQSEFFYLTCLFLYTANCR